MARESLQSLYVEQLQDLFSAEKQILKALPKIIDKTTHAELKKAFQQHERVTRGQVTRLEKIFADLGEKPGGETCKGMKGLLEEGESVIEHFDDSDVLDAGLIAAAQRVEHYEMAGYGCARTYATMLGLADQATLLQETLDEEGDANKELTQLAEQVVNVDALKA